MTCLFAPTAEKTRGTHSSKLAKLCHFELIEGNNGYCFKFSKTGLQELFFILGVRRYDCRVGNVTVTNSL